MEDVILCHLPLIRLTTQLKSIRQVQSIVIRIDWNVVTKELMNFLHYTMLISRSQFLNVVNTTNVGKVYDEFENQVLQI